MLKRKKSKDVPVLTIIDGLDTILIKDRPSIATIWQLHPSLKSTLINTIAHAVITHTNDSLDRALAEYAAQNGVAPLRNQPMTSFDFNHDDAMSGNIWHSGEHYKLMIKGMPEAVIERCDLSENEREQALIALQRLSAKGHQVIAVAHQILDRAVSTLHQLDHTLIFDGYVCLDYPFKPRTSLKSNAGSVYILTGSHPETAFFAAKHMGIAGKHSEIFDSHKMTVLSDEQLRTEISGAHIFARLTPSRKKRLLTLLAP